MTDLTNWMMVFLRASSMLTVFPVFSARNFPVQLRLALGALLAVMVGATLPATPPASDTWGMIGEMAAEIGIGLMIGFASRMIFFALEIAGAMMSSEIGLQIPPGLNPLADTQMTAPASLLYYLAAMIWLSLDLHHWMLVGFQKTYSFLPIGSAHLSQASLVDIVERSSEIFGIALQLAAPLLAVSFIISLIFAILGRAVPQMNVFAESFAVRPLVGLTVFGFSLELMSEHIINYLRRLPEDMLRVSQLLHS
ncbi:MAG TPA: flagellar biosynthetic protein FliR [Verrucomicrobiae bacterium]|jgi:flagellar biosynthetic protein FliR|nr:flagellar biosynthetic protein FliR [Verrucomicrobiae bacterium]